jgi:hypothetical protein
LNAPTADDSGKSGIIMERLAHGAMSRFYKRRAATLARFASELILVAN